MKKPLKIAVIGSKGLPPKEGGIEHYCAEVYPRMVEWGNSVDFYARAGYMEASWFERSVFKGVRVFSLPGLEGGLDALAASGIGALMSVFRSYDIVHFHALGPSVFAGIPGRFGAKIVVTCHGLDWQRGKWGSLTSRLIQSGERVAVNHADSLIVVSKALQAYFLNTYDKASTHITNAPATYLPADPAFAYGKSLGLDRGRYIVFLGRLVPEKRPDLLIEAFSQMSQADWKLVIAGGDCGADSYRDELFAMAAGRSDIIFTGPLQGAYLSEIVEGAGLFVLPSDLEGFPLSLLEAMRSGIPAIGSDIPPHKELLGEERGRLFSMGNAHSCREALEWAIANPEQMAAMADRAATYVNTQHSWEKIAAENLAVYHRVLSQAATSLPTAHAAAEVAISKQSQSR